VPPALIISLLLGSLYGLLFFLLAGKSKRGFWVFWLIGAVGFIAGQFIAEYVRLTSVMLGDVHVIEGSLVCWVLLFILYNKG